MIFIIGGNGFVGSSFSQYCKNQNLEYQIITRENYSDFIGKSCNILINASGSSSKLLGNKDPVSDFDKNVKNTLKTINDFQFTTYILLSSCDVYPDCSSPHTTKEDSKIELSQQNTYGFHKYLAELCVIHYTKDWIILRLGGMVGKGLKKNPIFDIIHGGPLWLDPKSQLQFLNTYDVAQITFELIKKNISNEIYNICGDGLVLLKDIIAKHDVISISPESSVVKYDVDIEKIKHFTSIPKSEKTVMDFIEQESPLDYDN
jgi:nucleoside-diphosphate-sugar epimerase